MESFGWLQLLKGLAGKLRARRHVQDHSRLVMTLILAAPAGTQDVAADESMTPLEGVASTPKGELRALYGLCQRRRGRQ